MNAREQAEAWVFRVWGAREGFAALGVGFGGHYKSGSYTFRSFAEDFYRWPEQADTLVDKALKLAPEADVYVAPLLRSTRSRKKVAALPGQVVWADLDAPREQTSGFERVLIGPSGLLVDSGQGGHRHVYLWLPDELEPSEIEQLNRHLAAVLGADAGWDASKYLRLPGTLNHKPRAAGGQSTPVQIIDGQRAPKDWTVDELLELLGPPPDANGAASRNPRTDLEPVMPTTALAHLLARLDEEPGDRSEQMWSFVGACLKAGLSDAETLALTLEHRPTKYIAGSTDRRVERISAAIRWHHEHQDGGSAQVRPPGTHRDAPWEYPGGWGGKCRCVPASRRRRDAGRDAPTSAAVRGRR